MKSKIIIIYMIMFVALSAIACSNNSESQISENVTSNYQTINETFTANEATAEKEMAGGTTVENTIIEKNIAENIEFTENTEISTDTESTAKVSQKEELEMKEIKIRITVGGRQLTATLENNATTRAIVEQMPMTLHMMDLYGREMCYRYGAYALPTDNMRDDNYAVGDIAYWAPGGSLVILYEQNGEEFSRQHLGHIDSGVEVFKTTGDADVTFELME